MDRQDIDALLIGALYGELTPADEARLATHLESHPTDRGALDDLKIARQRIAESRFFAVQLEPPQAISAILLQEAHRRAPRRAVAAPDASEGWFARFARNFMAHPAMAAAAMLVLVLGGAGILGMRRGDARLAPREAAASPERTRADPATAAPAPEAQAVPAAEADKLELGAAGSGYNAQLYEGPTNGIGDGEAAGQAGADRARARDQQADGQKAKQGSISVGAAERAPKDFESLSKNDSAAVRQDSVAKKAKAPAAKGSVSADDAFGDMSTSNAVSGAGRPASADEASDRGYAQPPPPPPSPSPTPSYPPTTTATTSAPGNYGAGGGAATTNAPKKSPAPAQTTAAPKTATKSAGAAAPVEKPAEPKLEPRPEAPPAPQAPTADAKIAENKAESAKESMSLTAWAKGEHQRAIQLAKNNDCASAAKVAASVSNRAPAYYSQYMSTDRLLKQCAQYINAERDKDAARSQKAPTKRVNADESSSSKIK